MLKQQVVHGPELPLNTSRLGSPGRKFSVRVEAKRKVAKHQLNPTGIGPKDLFHHLRSSDAKWALKVTERHDGDLGCLRTNRHGSHPVVDFHRTCRLWGGATTRWWHLFDLSALTEVGEYLRVYDNDVLTYFGLPVLISLGDFLYVYNNPALAQCLVDALVAQIEANKKIISISGGYAGNISFCGWGCTTGESTNNESCSCSEVDGVLVADCPP